jgi:hypothetical protein
VSKLLVSRSKSFRNVAAESERSWKEAMVEFKAVIRSRRL